MGFHLLSQRGRLMSMARRSSSHALDAGGFGNRGGVAVVGGDQAEVGEGLEDGAAGGPGGGCLVAGQAGHGAAVGGQGLADLTFDEAEDQQGQADHGDQGGDAAAGLQEQGGNRERAFELAVAALDDVLALVAAENLRCTGLAWLQVRQQGVPAVGGGLSVERGLVKMPGQGWFAGGAAADRGAQVRLDAALGGDRGDPGGDRVGGGVEAGPGGAHQPVEVCGGLGELARAGFGRAGGVRRGVHQDPAQVHRRAGLARSGQVHPAVFQHPVNAPGGSGLPGVTPGNVVHRRARPRRERGE